MADTDPDAFVPESPLLFDIGEAIGTATIAEEADAPEVKVVDTTAPLPFAPLTGAAFDPKRIFRYALWRRFLEKGPTLMFTMLNGSTADELKNDPTITRCEGFGRDLGFARVVVGNLFAFRSTDPKKLKWAEDPVGPDNDQWLLKLRKMSDMCIVAWGTHGNLYNRDQVVIELLRPLGPLHCLRKTKKGFPNHPLYLPRGLKPMEF